MANNQNAQLPEQLQCDTSRRDFLGKLASSVVLGTTGLATQALVQEVKASEASQVTLTSLMESIPYRESSLGIDYRELVANTPPPSPQDPLFANMLSQGEAEWLENAIQKYGEKASQFWETAISRRLAMANPSENIIDKLREFTPQMLRSFSKLLRDDKYGLLSSYGSLYISEQFANNV